MINTTVTKFSLFSVGTQTHIRHKHTNHNGPLDLNIVHSKEYRKVQNSLLTQNQILAFVLLETRPTEVRNTNKNKQGPGTPITEAKQ